MLQLSNNLCRVTRRLLNIRFLNTPASPIKLNGASTFNFVPALNTSYVKNNPSIIPLKLPLNNNLNRLKIQTPGLRQTGCDYIDPIINNFEIEAPSSSISDTPKQAARLIVIRRKKMKKHKLRKLRKRMKFEWAKRRQRRELRKEKTFQAGLIMQYKEAETFSAEDYVKNRLEKMEQVIVQEHEKALLFKKLYNIKLK